MISGLITLILTIQVPFASSETIVPLSAIEVSDSSASKSGERYVQIDDILVIGNKRTKKPIILREMALKQGHVVSYNELKEQIEADKKNIYNTKLFNTVEASILELPDEKIDIIISVSERWYTFPNLILELDRSSRNLTEWWKTQDRDLSRINYGLKLNQRNVRGRNETLNITAQLGFTKKLGINYSFPYLDKKQKHGLDMRASYAENNNIFIRTEYHKRIPFPHDFTIYSATHTGASYTYRNSYYDYHNVNISYNSNTVADSILITNSNYFSGEGDNKQKMMSISYSYKIEKRDVVAYPLKGYFFQGSIRKMGLGIFDDVDFVTATLAYAKYFDLGKGFYLANMAVLYGNTTNKISYNNYYGIGFGTHNVRGYELFVIEGKNFVLNKATLKKRIIDTSFEIEKMPLDQFKHFPLAIYLKSFFDAGYVSNYDNYEINSLYSNKVIYGAGLGFDIHTLYDLVFRFEWSVTDYNLTPDISRFTFSIGKEF